MHSLPPSLFIASLLSLTPPFHFKMDKENMLCFPHDFPYEFSDDSNITGPTHRFYHSASFQQPLFSFKEESFFSSSRDSALRWSSPSVNSDEEDYWNLIYAAASEVARMKMKMNNSFPGQRGYSGDRRLVSGHSAWGPPPVKCNGTTVKRECAGTGVFLPRPPPQACSPANLPPRMIQSSNKSFVPITTRPEVEAHRNGGFVSHYEMLISQRNALILAAQQRRSSMNRSVMESPMNNNNPEVLLPQEWTY